MNHLILTFALIVSLGTSIGASQSSPYRVGDVFWCDMHEHMVWKHNQVTKQGKEKIIYYRMKRFKFNIVDETTFLANVDETTVKFGSEPNYFKDLEMKITRLSGTSLRAQDEHSVLVLQDGWFSYVSAIRDEATLIPARCFRGY